MSGPVPAWLRAVLGWTGLLLWGLALIAVAAPAAVDCPMPVADLLGEECAGSRARAGWAAVWVVLALATSFAYLAALLRRDDR
ncbi:MAG TPA: hypothetical protein VGX28_16740 [Frankiaceae bacterium]|jgi:hypothetical protein|nr:hypothetical protein [Frankiaceae bacterium]